VQVIPVDAHDDAAFARWYTAHAAGASAGRTDPPIWTLPESLVLHRESGPDAANLREAYAAVTDAGAVVGAGHLEAPLRDNPRYAFLGVDVPTEYRARGVGTAVYARLVERAAELGRTVLGAELHQPFDAPEVPGAGFAKRRGFTRRNVEIRRVLRLPVPRSRLDELAAHAAERSGGYVLRQWRGPCPDELAEQYAYLKSLLMTDAPMGELQYEPEVWDVARLRAREQQVAEQGRTALTAVAIAPDGRLAGHTQIGVPGHEPGVAYQWDTLVLTGHRGHRLGLALKVANLRTLLDGFPDRHRLTTYNAEQNGPMVAVNDALGFRPVEYLEEWQRS
jgi:RimJ/RimL family protein N-acetyltransferase/GNAT superfamily N-acetyltransferase